MNKMPRGTVWVLLSELFVDTQHTKEDLHVLGGSLQETGYSVEEIESILRREVAPVCGRWMLHPGAVGPWPMFDRQDLSERIGAHRQKPWYRPPLLDTGLLLMPGIKREWKVVRNAMCGQPDA